MGALPGALEDLGHDTTIVLPRYRHTQFSSLSGVEGSGATTRTGRLLQAGRNRDVIWHVVTISPRRRVVFVDVPEYYDRAGLYTERGIDYPDNAARFALLNHNRDVALFQGEVLQELHFRKQHSTHRYDRARNEQRRVSNDEEGTRNAAGIFQLAYELYASGHYRLNQERR